MLNNNKGMTLIELVIALILLMMIVMSFALFYVRALTWNNTTNKNSETLAIARQMTDSAMAASALSEEFDYGNNHVIKTNAEEDPADREVSADITWGGTGGIGAATSSATLEMTKVTVEPERQYGPENVNFGNEAGNVTGITDAGRNITYKVYLP